MKRILFVFSLVFLLLAGCQAPKMETSVPHRIKDGRIILEVPSRQNGQKSALRLACAPIDTVRVGFIGLGMRGKDAVYRFTCIEGTQIKAICDLEADRVERSRNTLTSRGMAPAAEYVGKDSWKALCEREDIDLVYICTPWEMHVPMAVYAMEQGKHVAVEVPAAMSIAQCWQLVDTAEKTGRHCMMLENCCYDFFEMTALNMAQQGLFGEVLHVEGGYVHNLDPYWTEYHDNWRLKFNQSHRGDVYPTHGIGPVCQVLDIHRGDRMDYLVSMDTKSVHGTEVARQHLDTEEFASGDHTVTLIRTAQGKQIEIQHNVYTRRPYDRLYQITGTDGFACKYPVEGLALRSENIDDESPDYQNLDGESFVSDDLRKELMERYKPSFVADIEAKAREVGGHGGMDYIMDYRLIYCLRNGLPLDQDVYDAAEWSCLTELSALSIAYGSMPVEVPDFTRGEWNRIRGYSYASVPQKVIFDTDMGNDIDDALALDMLYKYMDAGKVDLLAVMLNKEGEGSARYVDMMNTWYGYPDIPIGIIRDGIDYDYPESNYAEKVSSMKDSAGKPLFPTSVKNHSALPESSELYRKVLASQPDNSVTIVSVGFSTNLKRLLESVPDEYSDLTGRELVRRKVRLLCTMAGDFRPDAIAEFNVVRDIPAAKAVFEEWPSPVVTSPFEVGLAVLYPATSIENDFGWADPHPVVEGYKTYNPMPYDRPCWDLTSVLFAVEGENWFTMSPSGKITVDDEGYTVFSPDAAADRRYMSVTEAQAARILDRLVELITSGEGYLPRAKESGMETLR